MFSTAIKIKFDSTHNVEPPTLVLATKSGRLLGKLPAKGVQIKDCMNARSDLRFTINKVDCIPDFWDKIRDFRLIWAREWNAWFELYISINESNETSKTIQAYSLGEVELSQVNLYNIEINTEDDISRDDYEPTVLYDEEKPSASLLHRITEKIPHYKIGNVDSSIAQIQRTFTFDNTTIYDAFQDISEEIDCLFDINCYSDSFGKIVREINVYDLESNCSDCGHRGEFSNVCPKCGSENIKYGFGDDTSIFISTDNLADSITYEVDEGSVKNCFRLEAGDDLMTATVMNCNPNGSGYIWYISDDSKEDMSSELVSKLNEYDRLYEYYQTDYQLNVDDELLDKYNALISKYSMYSSDYQPIISPIVGYPALMEAYYNTIDFYLYLNNSLMPNVEMSDTSAELEGNKLTHENLSPVAVQNIKTCTSATATSSVLAMAKAIVDSRYQVKVSESAYDNHIWSGTFVITNYSDEDDTYTTPSVSVDITEDYEEFVRQKIEKVLSKQTDETTDIVGLFDLDEDAFKDELKKYSLSRLTSFYDCGQSCIDILIKQGVADKETWANQSPDMYNELYMPYYNKLSFIQDEIAVRENEISVIIGIFDNDGDIAEHGIQTFLENERSNIQNDLNFEKYLGEELWLEFAAYRREDTYSNNNYISDGLNNAELFQNALEFINVAQKDIYKSATMQHSISASLKNLLVMKEFAPIVDHFKVGNWLRIKADNKIYVLRLIEYEVNFDNLEKISVAFSDVKKVGDSVTSDLESVISQAQSMASSYSAVTRQASKGKKSNDKLDDWVNHGLALTNMKIVDSADNQNITWDSHGLLCTEYLPITDSYSDKQLKIINSGLYVTNDNWLTSKAGIGNFTFYNPESGNTEEAYGVIADTLVGNLILSERVGIYNTKNSITLGENGVTITTDNTGENTNQMVFTIQKKSVDDNGEEVITPSMYIDSDGNVVLNGSIKINSASDSSASTLDDLADKNRYADEIDQKLQDIVQGTEDESGVRVGGLYSYVDSKFYEQQDYTNKMLNDYKHDLGQYLNYDENGLTLGASTGSFKTIIDNQRLAFCDGDTTVAYISNNQLYIPNAVIQQTLSLGKFLFATRNDGGFSILWQGD